MKFLYTLFCLLLPHLLMSQQSLSGIWEGQYSHYKPTCCDEYNNYYKLKIYEDARGAMWISTEITAFTDEHAMGQLFAVGYRLPDGRVVVKEIDEVFSSLYYVTSCFKNCTWCLKENLLTYKKQGKTETLTGLWNSLRCFPGGDVELKKVADLAPGDNIELMKLGRSEPMKTDPNRYNQYPLRLFTSDVPNEIRISLGFHTGVVKLPVDNVADFVKNEKEFIVQNVTMQLTDNLTYQQVVYFELKDKRNGKIYAINPRNISKKEILDLPYSSSGLTFPNKKQWDEIFAQANLAEELKKANEPNAQIKNRDVKINQKPLSVPRGSNVHIEVWDNNVEDGDIVSIYANNTCILDKHTLSKRKKTVSNVRLKSGKNTLTMFAENLGDIPPNTASMGVYIDGELHRVFILESDLKISEALEIIVE